MSDYTLLTFVYFHFFNSGVRLSKKSFVGFDMARDFVAHGRPLRAKEGSLHPPRGRLVASLWWGWRLSVEWPRFTTHDRKVISSHVKQRLNERTVGLLFSSNLKRFSQYLYIQICCMVRNDSQCTQLIICKLDHLWYATGKDQTNLFFSFLFFFSVQVKN